MDSSVPAFNTFALAMFCESARQRRKPTTKIRQQEVKKTKLTAKETHLSVEVSNKHHQKARQQDPVVHAANDAFLVFRGPVADGHERFLSNIDLFVLVGPCYKEMEGEKRSVLRWVTCCAVAAAASLNRALLFERNSQRQPAIVDFCFRCCEFKVNSKSKSLFVAVIEPFLSHGKLFRLFIACHKNRSSGKQPDFPPPARRQTTLFARFSQFRSVATARKVHRQTITGNNATKGWETWVLVCNGGERRRWKGSSRLVEVVEDTASGFRGGVPRQLCPRSTALTPFFTVHRIYLSIFLKLGL